jgi:hypothetical protein
VSQPPPNAHYDETNQPFSLSRGDLSHSSKVRALLRDIRRPKFTHIQGHTHFRFLLKTHVQLILHVITFTLLPPPHSLSSQLQTSSSVLWQGTTSSMVYSS